MPIRKRFNPNPSTQSPFDKSCLAELLSEAKGDRSINEWAVETDISAAHISRLLRGEVDSPPSPHMLGSFANNARNGISYAQLMVASGHVGGTEEELSHIYMSSRDVDAEKKMRRIIIEHLLEKKLVWGVSERSETRQSETRYRPDFHISISTGEYDEWLFEFKTRPSGVGALSPLYGQIARLPFSARMKFTIAVASEPFFALIRKDPPVAFNGNIYVMLIDLEAETVVKEIQICSYR